MFISPAFAQAGGAPGGGMMEFLPLILILVVFYFLLIRPQQKRAKEHKAMVAAVKRGDQVVTAGGILGKVTKVESGEEVVVEIADGIRVNIVASTLSDVRAKGEPAKDNDN
jgi:preprotein translocase subunit YajC